MKNIVGSGAPKLVGPCSAEESEYSET